MKYLLLFLITLSAAAAISVSPASHNINMHEGIEQYTLTIINDEQRVMIVSITPVGSLQSLIAVPANVTIQPGSKMQIPVKINMPTDTQPGILESGIRLESMPVGAGTVSASSAVMHVIRINTPRNGTYITGELLASAGVLDAPLYITLSLTNTGTEPATITTTIYVANQTIKPDSITLKPEESKNIGVSWTPELTGVYTTSAIFQYNGKETTLTNTITVGNLSVIIKDLRAGEFRIGDLFALTPLLNNEWIDEIPATTNITINQQGKVVVSGASTALRLKPLEITSVPIIMDSALLLPGAVNVTVNVRYADRLVTATYPAFITIDAFVIGAGRPSSQWQIAVAAALAIVLSVLAWYTLGKRKR